MNVGSVHRDTLGRSLLVLNSSARVTHQVIDETAAEAVGRRIDFHGQAFGTYGQGENKNTQEANDESGD